MNPSPVSRPSDASLTARLERLFGAGVDPAISIAPQPQQAPTSATVAQLLRHESGAGRYEIRGEIARGGMGAILEVWDRDLRRPLAMKVALEREDKPDSRAIARFLEEAQITSQLDHPGVVPVHELGVSDQGQVYFTMRRVQGRDLREIYHCVHYGLEGWTEARTLGVLMRVCDAVAFAHSRGVIHRDLKPANVMVGEFGEVYVMDWGLARVVGRERVAAPRPDPHDSVRTVLRDERERSPDSPLVTLSGDVMGTPAYMAPEQARGELESLSARTDVYAIGAMLYHLLALEPPYFPAGRQTTPAQALEDIRRGPPRPLHAVRSGIAPELAAVCEKAMAYDPADRYPDVAALGEDLRAFLEERIEHPSASIFEISHLTTPLVFLYVGVLVSCLGPLLVLTLAWDSMDQPSRLGLTALTLSACAATGRWLWMRGRQRDALAPLLGVGVTAPVLVFLLLHLVPALREVTDPDGSGTVRELLFTRFSPLAEVPDPQSDGLLDVLAQRRLDRKMLLTALGGLATVVALFRSTRAPAFLWLLCMLLPFAYQLAAMTMGWREWSDAWRFFSFLPLAAGMIALGMRLDLRRFGLESLPFLWVGFLLACGAWFGYASDGFPLRHFVELSHGEEPQLSMVLGGVLALGLGMLAMRFPTPRMDRFSVIVLLASPAAVLLSLSVLVHDALRLYEVILPLACLVFVSLSVLIQRKNLLYSGAGYLSIAAFQITRNHFLEDPLWPFILAGIGAAFAAMSLALPDFAARYVSGRVTGRRRGPKVSAAP